MQIKIMEKEEIITRIDLLSEIANDEDCDQCDAIFDYEKIKSPINDLLRETAQIIDLKWHDICIDYPNMNELLENNTLRRKLQRENPSLSNHEINTHLLTMSMFMFAFMSTPCSEIQSFELQPIEI